MREVYFKFIGPHYIKMEAENMDDKERQDRIWEHCEKLSEEMLEWEKEDNERIEAGKEDINSFYKGM